MDYSKRWTDKCVHSTYLSAFVFCTLVVVLHGIYYIENEWGRGFVTAYLKSDAHFYFHKAWYSRFIAADGGFLGQVIPFSPYIASLSVFLALFQGSVGGAYVLNMLCIVGTAFMVYLSARNIYGRTVALASGLLVSLCGTFIFYSGLTHKPPMVLMGVSIFVYFALKALDNKSWIDLFFSLSVLAIVSWDRENVLIFSIPLVWYFGRASALRFSSQCCLAIMVFFPVFIRSLFALFITDNGIGNSFGVNFIVGNAPGATGGYSPIVGIENNIIGARLGVINELQQGEAEPLSAWRYHAAYLKDWLDYYRTYPLEYAALKLKHLLALVSQYSYGHPEQYAYVRWNTLSTSVAFFDWSSLMALASVGFLSSSRSDIKVKFLVSLLFFYGLTIFIFLVTERYRLVLYILMFPLAGQGLIHLVAHPSYKKILVFSSIFLASVALNHSMSYGFGWEEGVDNTVAAQNKARAANRNVYDLMHLYAKNASDEAAFKLAEAFCEQALFNDGLALLTGLSSGSSTSRRDDAEQLQFNCRMALQKSPWRMVN